MKNKVIEERRLSSPRRNFDDDGDSLEERRSRDISIDRIDFYTNMTSHGITKKSKMNKFALIKLLIAFWLIGLCNNINYSIMIFTAYDLITNGPEDKKFETLTKTFKRECNAATGAEMILAVIIPTIFVKSIAPFLPLMIHVRFIILLILSSIGFIIAAIGIDSINYGWLLVAGLILISLSSGLGESSFLGYAAFFPTHHVISTWASGSAASSLIGSIIHIEIQQSQLSQRVGMLLMMIWPTMMAIAFWGLLPHPFISKSNMRYSMTDQVYTAEEINNFIPNMEDSHTILGKLKITQKIVPVYTAPYSIIFFCEYFSLNALYETIYYPNDIFNTNKQKLFYPDIFRIGVFIGSSTMNILEINSIWTLSVLQILNTILLVLEVFFGFLYFLVICMACIFWQGLLAGTTIVQTYRRIITDVPPSQREFSMSINTFGDSLMISAASLIAIPFHRIFCRTVNPYEQYLLRQRNQNLTKMHSPY